MISIVRESCDDISRFTIFSRKQAVNILEFYIFNTGYLKLYKLNFTHLNVCRIKSKLLNRDFDTLIKN
jgi:hypothetical protein